MASQTLKPNSSFERKQLMKKVEDLVAAAEATVTSDNSVHVSDVSSSSSEDDGFYYGTTTTTTTKTTKDTSNGHGITEKKNGKPLVGQRDVSILYRVGSVVNSSSSSSSLGSIEGIKTKPLDKRNSRKSNHEKEMDFHRVPTPVISGGGSISQNPYRSLAGEMYLETNTQDIGTADDNNDGKIQESIGEVPKSQQRREVEQQQKPFHHYNRDNVKKLPPKPAPQDRSVTSMSISKASASSSTATPSEFLQSHEPIISPPFTITSPSANRTRRMSKTTSSSKSNRNSNSHDHSDNDRPKSSKTRYYYKKSVTQSERKPSYKKVSGPSSIISPPKPRSAIKADKKHNSIFNDMKQEIEELRAQFEELDKQASRRGLGTGTEANKERGGGRNKDPEKLFQHDVKLMDQKTNAMADALHRNYVRSDQLQRENDALKKEYNDLRTSFNRHSTREDDKQEGELYGDENDDSYYEQNVEINPESLLRDLDPSDGYVKRKYPPVPKTPGTMFATEFIETMKLEVGEHAYLAEIMDRQWRTSRDYRP